MLASKFNREVWYALVGYNPPINDFCKFKTTVGRPSICQLVFKKAISVLNVSIRRSVSDAR